MLLFLSCFAVILCTGLTDNLTDNSSKNGQVVKSIEGGKVHLPCDISSGQNDSVYLVLWYRMDSGTPIYSYDSRTGDPNNPGLWSEPKAFGQRASFDISSSPALLTISNLSAADTGTYTCRVDYTQSPTTYKNIDLLVIVPPKEILIQGEEGSVYQDGYPVGPLKDGEQFVAVCTVKGGFPDPDVKWYRENVLLDNTTVVAKPGEVKNTLTVESLSRYDLGTVYRCVASNNNETVPLSTSISLDIMFPPLGVKFLSENQPMASGTKYKIGCVTWGSIPPAQISWFRKKTDLKGMIPLKIDQTTNSGKDNMTTSWISFQAKADYHRETLYCRASNKRLNEVEYVEDVRPLNIYYKPKVRLELGRAVNPKDLEEGDDLYFECRADSNPPPNKITWRHNGMEVKAYQEGGTIIANHTLVIQKVNKRDSGNYTCEVFNVEGSGMSNNLNVTIMYKPECSTGQKTIYGVHEDEPVHISCKVDSYPTSESFKWMLNTSLGVKEIMKTEGSITNLPGYSILEYRPISKIEFGTILCIGKNIVGKQTSPCLFHVIPASSPETPGDCEISNQTTVGIKVTCTPGFDGGLAQRFNIEVIDVMNQRSVFNDSKATSDFHISGINSGSLLYIRIYAENAKGKSKPVMLHTQYSTLPEVGSPVREEDQEQEGEHIDLLVVVFAGFAFTLLALCVGALLHCRSHRRSNAVLLTARKEDTPEDVNEQSPDLIEHTLQYNQAELLPQGIKDSGSLQSSDSSGFCEMSGTAAAMHHKQSSSLQRRVFATQLPHQQQLLHPSYEEDSCTAVLRSRAEQLDPRVYGSRQAAACPGAGGSGGNWDASYSENLGPTQRGFRQGEDLRWNQNTQPSQQRDELTVNPELMWREGYTDRRSQYKTPSYPLQSDRESCV